MEKLNFNVYKERQLVFALFDFYDHILELYRKKYKLGEVNMEEYEDTLYKEVKSELSPEQLELVEQLEAKRKDRRAANI